MRQVLSSARRQVLTPRHAAATFLLAGGATLVAVAGAQATGTPAPTEVAGAGAAAASSWVPAATGWDRLPQDAPRPHRDPAPPSDDGVPASDGAQRGSTPHQGRIASPGTVPWRLPVDGALVRGFQPPPQPWAAGHRGVDLRTTATVVSAPAPGVVTFAGQVAGRGVVTILHAGGLRTSLEPVTATVATGTPVRGGASVATLEAGESHCSPATCLHWGVRRGDVYLDPMTLLGTAPVVLLPLP